MKLEGKKIVITGGTSGIGYEVVRQLHGRNRVLVIGSNRGRLDRLAAEFAGIRTCCADLSGALDVESAADEAHRHFGSIDLLINNAAVQYGPTFLDPAFSYASIRHEIAVNLTALCSLTALLLPALLHEQEAAIVNVNSGLALMPKTTSAVYCASKAGVNVFSQSLRWQLAGTNVSVLQAFMPLVNTPMTTGRGRNKMSAAAAAAAMLRGIEQGIEEHDIGKVRLLRPLIRLAPGLARRIMQAA